MSSEEPSSPSFSPILRMVDDLTDSNTKFISNSHSNFTENINGSTGASAEESSLGLTPQQKDTTWTKLFVGGLPYHTSDKSLRDHFKVYGEIEEAVVITDRQTSKSRGYGFVIMSTRQAAELACKANPIIDGRKANVNLAILGAKPRGNLAATAFPLAIRAAAGYPGTTLLNTQGYQGFGIQPGSYIYQPAYNGTHQILSLPAATSNPLAALTGGLQHQFYDYHQQQAGLAVSAASQATLAGSHGTHFAAPGGQFFAATDPYSQAGYIAASQQAANQAAVHHPYAAYALPQLNTTSGTTSTVGSIPYPYAAVAQDSRIQ